MEVGGRWGVGGLHASMCSRTLAAPCFGAQMELLCVEREADDWDILIIRLYIYTNMLLNVGGDVHSKAPTLGGKGGSKGGGMGGMGGKHYAMGGGGMGGDYGGADDGGTDDAPADDTQND